MNTTFEALVSDCRTDAELKADCTAIEAAMSVTLAKHLNYGVLFRAPSGELHLVRSSEQDVEDKLLKGQTSDFCLISAIREVADVELSKGFGKTKDEYIAIAKLLESMVNDVGGDFASGEFADGYRLVARLVREHADTL
jgi:hypothetical protein